MTLLIRSKLQTQNATLTEALSILHLKASIQPNTLQRGQKLIVDCCTKPYQSKKFGGKVFYGFSCYGARLKAQHSSFDRGHFLSFQMNPIT